MIDWVEQNKSRDWRQLVGSLGTAVTLQASDLQCHVAQEVPYSKKFVDKANKSQEFLDLFRGIVQDPNGKGTVPTIIGTHLMLSLSLNLLACAWKESHAQIAQIAI